MQLFSDSKETLSEDYLGKMSKLKVALTALMTQDAAKILEMDRSSVQAFDDHLMGQQGQKAASDEMMIIGDDIRINEPATPGPSNAASGGLGTLAKGILATALGLGALGGGTGAALWGWSQLQDKGTTNTTIENTEGFLLDFPD